MTTNVTFRAFVKDDDGTYYCYRLLFKDIECIPYILTFVKNEFFKTSLASRVVVNYHQDSDDYKCVIERL